MSKLIEYDETARRAMEAGVEQARRRGAGDAGSARPACGAGQGIRRPAR